MAVCLQRENARIILRKVFPIPLFVYLLALLTPQSGASTGIDLFVCLCVYFLLFPFPLCLVFLGY